MLQSDSLRVSEGDLDPGFWVIDIMWIKEEIALICGAAQVK